MMQKHILFAMAARGVIGSFRQASPLRRVYSADQPMDPLTD
jgi:hypothetical protein